MIFKKLLISLGTLGIVGGSGAGIYFIKNQTNNQEIKATQTENLPTTEEEKGLNAQVVNQPNQQNPKLPLTGEIDTPLKQQQVPQASQEVAKTPEKTASDAPDTSSVDS